MGTVPRKSYAITYWHIRREKVPKHYCIVVRDHGPLDAVRKVLTMWNRRDDVDYGDGFYARTRRLDPESGDGRTDPNNNTPIRYFRAMGYTVQPLGYEAPPPGAPEEWTAVLQ